MAYQRHGRGGGEAGAALVTALILLIVITLLSLSSMRASTLELRMASNEQERAEAFQAAQAAVDGVVAEPGNFSVTGSAGYRNCTPSVDTETQCDQRTVTLPAEPFSAQNQVIVERLAPENSPVPRSLDTSSDKFSAAFFGVDSSYMRDSARGGAAQVVQGYLVLTPKSGQSN
jgi:Tfp pilus assembly protein PilX